MDKLHLYINNRNSLVLELENSKGNGQIKSNKLYEAIKIISKDLIKGIKQNDLNSTLIINYSDYELTIHNPKILLKKELFLLNSSIQSFYSKRELTNFLHKKVKRENKYSSKKIVVPALTLILLSSIALTSLEKNDIFANNYSNEPVVYEQNQEYEQNYESSDSETKAVDKSVPIDVDNSVPIKDLSNMYLQNLEQKYMEDPDAVLDYISRVEDEKAINTKVKYGDLITKYAKMYGIDPNLVIALATQERGEHSNIMDEGGAIGLMQIQVGPWLNKGLTAYNFEKQEYETIYIDIEKIKNLETNIQIGCIILQNAFRTVDYNILAGLQCYNMGGPNMANILNCYSINSNKPVEQILSNQNDIGWLDYRTVSKEGDYNYVENVLSYVGPSANIYVKRDDGSLCSLNISNSVNKVY